MSMGRPRKKPTPKRSPNRKGPNGRKIGAPSKMTPEVMNGIIGLLQNGITIQHACNCVGISVTAYHQWMREGEDAKEGTDLHTFRIGVLKARSLGMANLVEIIQRHAPKDWKAAAWMLERQHGELFGKKVENTIAHAEGFKPITIMLPPVVATPPPQPRRVNRS